MSHFTDVATDTTPRPPPLSLHIQGGPSVVRNRYEVICPMSIHHHAYMIDQHVQDNDNPGIQSSSHNQAQANGQITGKQGTEGQNGQMDSGLNFTVFACNV